jgi:hypothetical protein
MKLTKRIIKQLIKEAMDPNPNTGGGVMYQNGPSNGYDRAYKNGSPPDNSNRPEYQGSEEYETGPIKTHIEKGETYVTQGLNKFKLVFNNDDLTSGHVEPVGRHGFHITNGVLNWYGGTPVNVKNDSDLEKQILDYSGREK